MTGGQLTDNQPDFMDEEMKAQRGEVIFPRPHSYRKAEFEPKSRSPPSQLRLSLSLPQDLLQQFFKIQAV